MNALAESFNGMLKPSECTARCTQPVGKQRGYCQLHRGGEYFSSLAKTHTMAPQRSGTIAPVTPLQETGPVAPAARRCSGLSW
jgi:hypothetical protein